MKSTSKGQVMNDAVMQHAKLDNSFFFRQSKHTFPEKAVYVRLITDEELELLLKHNPDLAAQIEELDTLYGVFDNTGNFFSVSDRQECAFESATEDGFFPQLLH